MVTIYGLGAYVATLLLLLPAAMADTRQPSSTESPPPPPVVVPCSDEVRACWARGELWASGACHTPLEQGPCADAQWLVLDALALPKGTCAPRPCPPAQLPSRGRCLEEAEAREMCWSGAVHLNASGGLCCGASPGWSAILEAHVRCEAMGHSYASNYTNAYDGAENTSSYYRAYNYTDGGDFNYTSDRYYNHTNGGYYNSTNGYYGEHNYTDDGFYNSTNFGDYDTYDGYYNSTSNGYYNRTDDDYNSFNDSRAYNSTSAPPRPLLYNARSSKALATAGEQQALMQGRSDVPGDDPRAAASARASSVRVLAAGALCALLATRATRC